MDKSNDHSDSTRRVVVIEKVFFFSVSNAGGSEKNSEYSTKVEPIAFWLQLFKQSIALSTGHITIQWITELVFVLLNRWIAICGLGCSKVDNAIHGINHYPLDSAISFLDTCPLDSG